MKALAGSLLLAMTAVMTISSIPIFLLNAFGGIAAGIWLAVVGEWGSTGLGVLLLVTSTYVLAFAFLPTVLIEAPGLKLAERGYRVPSYFFGFLGRAYESGVIVVWVVIVFSVFVNRTPEGLAVIPALFWSYTVATTPITLLAVKEKDTPNADNALATAFFTQFGCIVLIVLALISDNFALGILGFIGVMLVGNLMVGFAMALARTVLEA